MKKLVLLTLVAGVGELSASDDAARRRLAKLVSAVGARENVLQDQSVASSQQIAVTQVLPASKEEMQTLFWQAMQDNDVQKVQTLLPKIDVNEKDKYGYTPFMSACRDGRAEVVKLLLPDSRVDVTEKDRFGYTPFMRACKDGKIEVVKLLLPDSRVDVTEKDVVGNTAFMRACSNGQAEVVKLLLADSRVDVTEKNLFGDTAFMRACMFGKIEVVKLLLPDSRVDVTEKDKYGYTAFMSACRDGQAEVVKLLLADSRVDVNEKNGIGYTPFMSACRDGQAEVVKLLLVDSRVDVTGIESYIDLILPVIIELKLKDPFIKILDFIQYLSTHEVDTLCAVFADDHELCVKIKEKVLSSEKAQEYIRWQMLEREKAASLPEQQKKQLAAPFAQELNWQEEGLVSFAHGCEYQFGIFRDAYARLQRKLSADGQKYPAYFHAFRFPTQKELQEEAWSKEQAQEQLTLRKYGRSDNSLYIFCQASVLHGIQNYKGESPGAYWLNNWSVQNISLTLAQVLQGLVDPIIIERYQHKLAQVQQLYDNTVTSSTKGLLYLFAVTPEFVKNCVGYRHNFTGKDELTSSEQYLQAGKYAQVEHLIPQLYTTTPEYVNAHIKDMKVYGYDKTTRAWKAYETKLEEVLDLLVHEQKELELIGKEAYYAKVGQIIQLQSRL